jgi:hypothetical protein
MKVKSIVPVLAFLLILGPGFSSTRIDAKEPPAPCRIGELAPPIGFWTWAANSRVKVYVLASDFKPEIVPYLLTALQNWNSTAVANGSGVQFEYQGTTSQQLTCESCLTLMRGQVFDKSKRHATELRAFSIRHDQIINYAAIVIDPSLTNPRALTDAIAHELGHNLGLLDCYTCKKKSTLMNQLKAMNVPNDMATPTPCDVAQVRAAYQELKIHVRPSPPNRNLIDVGEEPVDDDTPVIIPKP